MTDIVKRLRWRATNTSTPTATTPMLCDDAADEITRLRAALRDVLSWAHQVAGDTTDMEQREIEIASVERAIAALKEDGDE